MKPRLVVLSGAGMSAESGLATFRGVDGMWENHRIEEIASPYGWRRNPWGVLRFYNERRKQILQAAPNHGHRLLASWEKDFDVKIVTQNIDNLHERAGSSCVLHLHGDITKARSTVDDSLVYDIKGWELSWGDKCAKGSQLRPDVVWFTEPVLKFLDASKWALEADIFLIIGTSMKVHPAAGLIHAVNNTTLTYVIDPVTPDLAKMKKAIPINKGATEGLKEFELILHQFLLRYRWKKDESIRNN